MLHGATMTPVAWVALAVALLAAVWLGILIATSWRRSTMEQALEALADRPRLLSENRELRRSRDNLYGICERTLDTNDKLMDANKRLGNSLNHNSWAVHAWGAKGSERGQA
jgi:hypothetical protein